MMRIVRISLVALAGLLVTSCTEKDERFFRSIFGSDGVGDDTPPLITNLQPSTNVVLNDNGLGFTATDAESGVNVAGITAQSSTGTSFPVQTGAAPNTFVVDISSAPDGQHSIEVRVPDNEGNVATTTFSFTKDTSPPTVTFTERPAETGSTDQATVQVRFTGSATDANFQAGNLTVRQGQPGQPCGGNDPVFPQGTTPGTVNPNMATLGQTFDVTVTTTGAPNDQRPQTRTYCYQSTFSDQGVDRFGAPNPNSTTQFFRQEFTWARATTVPTGAQIAARGFSLTGVVPPGGNTCPGEIGPSPGPVSNPGPISITSEIVNGQTFVTVTSDAPVRGPYNTTTGEWAGQGRRRISGPFVIDERILNGRFRFEDTTDRVVYNTEATIVSRIINDMETPDPGDDVDLCGWTIQQVRYRQLD